MRLIRMSQQSLLSRAAVLTAGRTAASLVAAVWLVIAARILPLADFGTVSIGLALTLVLGTLSDFGLQTMLARDVVESQTIRRVMLDSVVRRRVVLALMAAVPLIALQLIATRSWDPLVGLLFGGTLVATAVYAPTLAAYRARGKVLLETISEVLSRVMVMAIGVPWLLFGGGATAFALTYLLVNSAAAGAVIIVVRRSAVDTHEVLARGALGLRRSAPYTLSNAMGVVYQRADQYLVGLLRGVAQAGLYGASYRLPDAVLTLPVALGQLALAHPEALVGADRRRLAARLALQSLAATLVPIVAVICFASQIMATLFGQRFAGTGSIVALLMASAIPGAVAASVTGLVAIREPRAFAWASGASLAVNVAMNLILIPSLSGVGAAIANVVSQTLLASALLLTIYRSDRSVQSG